MVGTVLGAHRLDDGAWTLARNVEVRHTSVRITEQTRQILLTYGSRRFRAMSGGSAADLPSGNDPRVPLEAAITSLELSRRPSRPADYAAESRAVAELMDAMAGATGTADADRVLQRLVEMACTLCRAHSAGVSILEKEDGHQVVRWRAATGASGRFLAQPGRYAADGPPIVEALLVPFHCTGRPVGTLWIVVHDETRRFDAEDYRLVTTLARCAGSAYQLLLAHGVRAALATQQTLDEQLARDVERSGRLQAALRDTQARLEAELADSELLRGISAELIRQDDVHALYEKIVDAALGIMDSDFATMQMLEAGDADARPTLKLLAFRGFSADATTFWRTIHLESRSTCGEALRTSRRVLVPDVERCEFMAGSEHLDVYRATGIRATQTTPLRSRTGALVGMISTHWRTPHHPSERDLRLLDILARLAADLLERSQREDALRAADRAKDEFLAMLGHELRNPLGALMAANGLLGRVDPSASEAVRARGVIGRQLQHLTHLVDDLLDVSRVMFGKIHLVRCPLDLAGLTDGVVEVLRAGEATLRHAISAEADSVWIDADKTRIEQILVNLVENAIKFTPPDGVITIRVRREAEDAVLTVEDTGVGIPADALPRIFNLFTQAAPTLDRSPGGLGLGLTVVRRLVELHGGTVEASSDGPGRGSVFTVRLPACDAPTPAASAVAGSATPTPRRVLVVEDDDDVRDSLATLLSIDGHDVRTAADGESGLDIVATGVPEIVFVDVGLPGVDGYEVARRLRACADGDRIHLIALTGYGQVEDQARAAAAGFDLHLVKPLDPDALPAIIARFFPPGRREDDAG